MSYPVGALLGRDFELLHAACLCALRRYLFFHESMPAWLVRLVAHPTHVMVLNGVYVRVLWISEAQMEELYIFIHQCYKVASSRTRLTILEHPQCHVLADMCKGRSELYFASRDEIPLMGDRGARQLPVRTLEQHISVALSRIELAMDPSGSWDFKPITQDILVHEETIFSDDALTLAATPHHVTAPPAHAMVSQPEAVDSK